MSLDSLIFHFFFNLASKNWFFNAVGVFFARYLPFLIFISAVFFLFSLQDWKKRINLFFLSLVSVIISRGIITESLSLLFKRPRPFEVFNLNSLIPSSGYSFPSDHMSFLFALSFSVFIFNKKWGIGLLSFSLLVGLERIFVGVHWPSDILAGIIIGIFSAFLSKRLILNKK